MPLLELVDFASQFTWLARKCVDEAPGVRASTFSSRQSIAIASLGTARILRVNSPLGVSDLVELAVTTSPPEAQGYSEMIALRLLMGDEREFFGEVESPEDNLSTEQEESRPVRHPSLTGQQMLLHDVLDYMQFASSVDHERGQSHLDFLRTLESTLFSKDKKTRSSEDAQQQLQDARRRTAFEVVGGRSGITKQGIDSWEGLMNRAEREIKKSVPSIDRTTMAQSQLLDMSQQIADLAREETVRKQAELLSESRKEPAEVSEADITSKTDSFTDNQLSQTLRTLSEYRSLLKRMKVTEESYAPSLEKVIDSVQEAVKERSKAIDDILMHPEVFRDDIDREQMSEMLETSWHEETPLESLQKAKDADDMIDTSFSERMYDEHQESFDKLEAEDYLQHPIPSPEWMEGFQRSVERFEQDGPTWDERMLASEQMRQVADSEGSHLPIGQEMTKYMKQQVPKMIDQSTTPEELAESVEFAKDTGLQFSHPSVKTKGQELGMSMKEIAQLIGGAYEYLKSTIESGEDPSYERVSSVLERASLTESQHEDLVKESVKHKASGALGALASEDLQQTIKAMPKTDEAKELLEEGLGAGGGENLLQQWFEHGSRLPKWARAIVKRVAKEVMIKLAKARAAALIGSSEAGPIPEGSARPYVIGDDLDSIDLDETIDNIIISGKRGSDIEVSDFIVRHNISGRRCVVFLVDISGSMSGAPLAGASLATAMLLFAFARDELGVALFESNSHIICEVGQPVELDQVVDEILDLQARGGTQMQAAIQWAEEQFVTSASTDKMFVMATDAHIGDFGRSSKHMRNIADMGASSVLIVPGHTYGLGNIQGIVDSCNAHLIVVQDWAKFPEVVSKVLSRS